jgi:trehalose/maltose hydrolase-like predicted phosphorylase
MVCGNTGDIQIEGDLDAQQRVCFALYNLYSFIRPETRQSIAPDCHHKGTTVCQHFRDTELDVIPPLHCKPDMAKSCLDYRWIACKKAKQKKHSFTVTKVTYCGNQMTLRRSNSNLGIDWNF